MTVVREIHLASRPARVPEAANFRFVERTLGSPRAGEVLVKNLYLSVDPYMRGRMRDAPSYIPPFELDAPLAGGAVGVVVESGSESLSPGDHVVHDLGWRTHALADAEAFRAVEPVAGVPLSAFLGVLGMPGLTAYVGVSDIARVSTGDTVFVSGAAGAVGSLAGQLARHRGAARVIGSAGSSMKVEHLVDDLGFDTAFDYRKVDVADRLKALAPDGLNVYFDNVGGQQLEAAVENLGNGGRVAMCGWISDFHAREPAGLRNGRLMVAKRLTLQGFIVSDHRHREPEFRKEVGALLAGGGITFRETVITGIDYTVDAFIGLFEGHNVGKMIVDVAGE
ncbi:NADP-dependent oxidoreductase [Actinomadura soli]|uniref:NADP-dependent oxidoreductase n=1 Tax=Actinomadura soli TaxID=2508997 RepID=A0A5C4JK28_9ACTN|nr:NADP-dependent oxidoreductase [Actinomadura soli]TMR05706.1 NADP-dependent oxidoreductase [Actinomadura soli]